MLEWRSREFRGNCLAWAVRQWCRRGGYLVIRRARLKFPFWHFMWMAPSGRLYHFRPLRQNVEAPWPLVAGYVSLGEDEL